MSERVTLVVSLRIQPGQDEAFEAHERRASGIMARYRGRIDSAVRIAGAGDSPFEVHLVSFPDRGRPIPTPRTRKPWNSGPGGVTSSP